MNLSDSEIHANLAGGFHTFKTKTSKPQKKMKIEIFLGCEKHLNTADCDFLNTITKKLVKLFFELFEFFFRSTLSLVE